MGWHSGERALQERAGFHKGDALRRVIQDHVPAPARDFLEELTLAFITTIDPGGRPWVSPVSGAPGFLRARDVHTVTIAAAGLIDPRVAHHVGHDGAVGMLAVDFATRRRMRLNGRAELGGDGALVVHAEEVYSNCPKYIQARAVGETTEHTDVRSPVVGNELTSEQQSWIATADTFGIGTHHPQAGADTSHRGGSPGFVNVISPTQLAFPDYAGNRMFQTLGNLLVDERVGLLFANFSTGAVLQITGRARVHHDLPGNDMPGAERWVEAHVDEVVETRGVLPYVWGPEEPSPFNPPVTGGVR